MPASYQTKVGDRYGTRVITGFLRERDSDGHLRCAWKCDCGATGIAGLKAFRKARNCFRCSDRNKEGGRLSKTHGEAGRRSHGTRSRLYEIWHNMKQRCNPASAGPRNRKWYGDRGITVCDEWKSFEGFRSWASAHGYKEGLSLDRLDSAGNYKPSNCQWLTRSENSRKSMLEQWARKAEIPYDARRDTTPIEMLWGVT
jgi:hypothetical protein